MKKNLYTIWDKVAKQCGPVFEAKNDAVAQRNFKNMLTSNKGINPQDPMWARMIARVLNKYFGDDPR